MAKYTIGQAITWFNASKNVIEPRSQNVADFRLLLFYIYHLKINGVSLKVAVKSSLWSD